MRLLGSLLVAALGLLSCGSVGEPLPPLLRIPAPVEDFRAQQVATDVIAEWTWPRVTTDGVPFEDLDQFAVSALAVEGDAPPATDRFERESVVVGSLSAADLAEKSPGEAVSLAIPVADRFGSRTAFALRSLSERGKVSTYSAYVILDLVRPPARAESPKLTVEPTGIRLSWSPLEGAAQYRIERRLAGQDDFAVQGRSAAPEYLDPAIVWESEHTYRIRGEAASASGLVPGEAGPRQSVTPLDVFAPAAPRGLRAVATQDSVELAWTANEEPDLAGYRVRRDGEPLHLELLPAPSLSDRSPASVERTSYVVTAVDLKGNESQPSEAVEVANR